jgi:hypothetical protein
MILRTKPPNPRCRRVSDLPPSMTHSSSSLTRPTGLRQVPRRNRLHLDLADTVFIIMYTCTRRCPKCQPPRLVTRPLGPSVQASRPSFTTPGPSARHVLLDLHLAVDYHLRAPQLHTTSQETCTHNFRHMVGLVTVQPTSWITLTITHHTTNAQGYLVREYIVGHHCYIIYVYILVYDERAVAMHSACLAQIKLLCCVHACGSEVRMPGAGLVYAGPVQ